MSMTSLDRSLAAWLDEVEPREAPSELLSRTFAVTRVTGQRRPLIARFSVAVTRARFFPAIEVSPLIAVALLALLVLLLLGAIVVGNRLFTNHSGWRLLDRPPAEGAYTWVSDVSAGGDRLVAVGNAAVPASSACGRDVSGRVWTSPDGAQWTDQTSATFADVRLEKVVQAGDKSYVIGTTHAACGGNGLPSYATWSSTDGVTWTALADSSALADSFVTSVVDVGGIPLAIGIYQEAEPPDGSGVLETRVWTATGSGWTLLATLDQTVGGKAVTSGGIVLINATDFEGKSMLFRSEDGGKTWSRPAGGVETGVDDVQGLAAAGGRFVLAGRPLTGDVGSDVVMLVSEDGKSWTQGEQRPAPIVDVWSAGGHFVAGMMEPVGGQDCAEWTSAPIATAYKSLEPGETAQSGPARPEPTGSFCVRIREPGFTTAVSEDGLTWRNGARLPERGDQLPEITVPIPGSTYSLAGTEEALVVVNPTFGEMLWFSPFGEFAESGETL
jgi:hypothetical protein